MVCWEKVDGIPTISRCICIFLLDMFFNNILYIAFIWFVKQFLPDQLDFSEIEHFI